MAIGPRSYSNNNHFSSDQRQFKTTTLNDNSTQAASTAATVVAECCPKPGVTDACADGYLTNTLGCCAYGSCNIFCCNCDGSCRQPRSRRSARDLDWDITSFPQREDPTCGLFESENHCALDKFEAIDTNHDGIVTLAEILAGLEVLRPYLASSGMDEASITNNVTTLFNTYDTDKNGNLTFAEALAPQTVNV
ncbi:hypothetical protein LTS07_010650 [Exophiala sideris]|nr:hypothetical protein LTS07_010650 [Exophiala sideris]KAK5176992.1 hypothetical protein LTR44_010429 [Eurotiomycetes sp. CCFEE 6388]